MSLKLFLLQSISRNKISRKGQKQGRKASHLEHQRFNRPQFKYSQIQKQPLWKILWNECSLKLGKFLTKACKESQCLRKIYTAIMKPLALKWILLQGPLTKMFNFSNNYVIVYIFSGYFSFYLLHTMRWLFESVIFYWKSSTRIDRDKFQKIFKKIAELQFLKPA